MSESSSSNWPVAPPERSRFREKFLEHGHRIAHRQYVFDCVVHTLGAFVREGCRFRSVGYDVLIECPPKLKPRPVATWVMRHRPAILAIIKAADEIEAAELGTTLNRLYFMRRNAMVAWPPIGATHQ